MAEAAIYRKAKQFKAALEARNVQATAELVNRYKGVLRRLNDRMDALAEHIEAARANGEAVNLAWLYQQERYRRLIAQSIEELSRYVDEVEPILRQLQLDAATEALNHQTELLRIGVNPPPGVVADFIALPREAVRSMIGFTSDGSPLSDLLKQLPKLAGDLFRRELVAGIALGINPKEIARRVSRAAGIPLSRTVTIARTEMMRAYREASHEMFNANKDIIVGWEWLATLSSRTCLACLAMHGTFHQPEERLESHPRCRCTQVPVTKSWSEMIGQRGANISETRASLGSAQEWFDELPLDTKRTIMGVGVYERYAAGDLQWTPKELVKVTRSPEWGRTIRPKPLAEMKK